MSTVSIAVLRARAAVPGLLSLALIVMVTTVALGATTGLIRSGVAEGSRETLVAAAAQASAVRVSVVLSDDWVGQEAAARSVFARSIPPGTVEVFTSAVSLPVPVLAGAPQGTRPGTSALFASFPDLAGRVEFTAGVWPAPDNSGGVALVAVQADAAEALALELGDELTVGTVDNPVRVRVQALWRASDPASAVWFADSAATAGSSGGSSGLFVLDEASLAALPTRLFAVWTIAALPGSTVSGDREALVEALGRLPAAMAAAPEVSETAPEVAGTLVATLERIDAAGRGAAAIGISAVFVIGMLGLVALLQVSTVLVGSRREQSGLLRARGLSRGQLTALTLGEGLLVVVPATGLGLLATVVLLSTVGGSVGVVADTLPYAIGTCLVAMAVLTAVVLGEKESASERRSLGTFAIGFGAVALAAALAVWQLQVQGSPVSPGSSGGVDLVTSTAPALALIAVCAVGTVAFIVFAPVISRRARRRGSVVAVLAGAQLDGRASRYLVPIVAVAIAVASGGFASGIAATWQSAQRQAHLVGIGADVDVTLRTDDTATADTVPVTAQPYALLDGVRAASAVVVTDVRLGSDVVPLVAVRPESGQRVLGSDGVDLIEALRRAHPAGSGDDSASGLPLPRSATAVQAEVAVRGDAPLSRFAVSIWAADADGSLARVPLTAVLVRDAPELAGVATLRGVLPAGTTPWRILAVESDRSGPGDSTTPELSVSGFAGVVAGAATRVESGDVVTLDIAGPLPRSRAAIAPRDPDAPMPVVLTAALADRVGLGVGDTLAVGFGSSGAPVDARVGAVMDMLPGGGSRLGIAVAITDLNDVSLRQGRTPVLAGDVWIDADDPGVAAVAAIGVATSTAIVATRQSTTSAAILQPAMDAFWVAAATAGLLALIALCAFIVDDVRARRRLVPVLVALGLSTAQQTATRARELVAVLAFAVAAGVVAGILATVAAVTPFASAAVPEAPTSVLPALDPLPWLVFCGALSTAALGLVGGLLIRFRRDVTRRTAEGAS